MVNVARARILSEYTRSIRLRPAAGLLPFARGSQSAVEEFGGGAVGADPIPPAEQVVNLAWRRVDPLNAKVLHRQTF